MLPPLFRRRSIAYRVSFAVAIVVLGCPWPAVAQTPLTKAIVTNFRNQVKLMPRNQPSRPARVSDQMKPGDGLATARSARADLRFNDGSLARIGQQVVFRFTAGTRNLALSNGTLLLLIPPGQGKTQVNTPNAVTGIQGSALFIRYDPVTGETSVGALTDSGIKVWNRNQTESRTLKAGQLLVVTKGPLQEPVNFDLQTFYQTSALVGDLHLNDSGFVDGDTAIAQVRNETLAGVATQTLAAQGRSTPSLVAPQSSTPIQDSLLSDRAPSSTLRPSPLPASTGVTTGTGATATQSTTILETTATPQPLTKPTITNPTATTAETAESKQSTTILETTATLQPLNKSVITSPAATSSETTELKQSGTLQRSMEALPNSESDTPVITNPVTPPTGVTPVGGNNGQSPTTPNSASSAPAITNTVTPTPAASPAGGNNVQPPTPPNAPVVSPASP